MAEREAQLLVPLPRTRLTKVQWRQFMAMRDEDFAAEVTRIDWIMFSAVRPRDLVRHISLPAEQKERDRSVENVNRMIQHFNHLAYWVTNVILLREKAKHRARALEKFMHIAWKLRYLNNYNALGAVIAGINGNAAYRLQQTRDLVSAPAQKDFMSLEILMGTHKGHFAYRMAWGNTAAPRIPFLPLHRRDLVSGEEGNRTFLDEAQTRINWKKFEVLGDVIVTLHRCQNTPYPDLDQHPDLQRLLLEVDLVRDDDDLYNRSVELEAPVAAGAAAAAAAASASGSGSGSGAGDVANGNGNIRRKFSWFQR
ncbi:MAG: hypothetical protein M1826_004680 [Phylliscum demangeonii]|nr:MAG: hypothetical protein M1826_004680 [Phylliscum demangeonii]